MRCSLRLIRLWELFLKCVAPGRRIRWTCELTFSWTVGALLTFSPAASRAVLRNVPSPVKSRPWVAGTAAAPSDGSDVLHLERKSLPNLEIWVRNLLCNRTDPSFLQGFLPPGPRVLESTNTLVK